MLGFWEQLHKPFTVLAPMDDVTDVVFRQIVSQIAPPDVYFTEFTNVDALCSQGRDAHIRRLDYTEDQRPIVAQIWGGVPEHYEEVSHMIAERGFDGIDINMGCPDKNVVKSGLCSALIENRTLADEIIAATKQGAGDIPVTVKTRLGMKSVQTEDWIGWLLERDLAVVSIHGRTVKQMSKVPADWEEIGKAVQLRDQMKLDTLIVGNGDIEHMDQVAAMHELHGVDGVMIGRGIFHNPWVFNGSVDVSKVSNIERFKVLKKHVELYEQTWENTKSPDLMKKFYKMYVAGFPNAHNMRKDLMDADGLSDAVTILESWIGQPS